MPYYQERLFRMVSPSTSVEDIKQQVQDLVATLTSVVQDLVVMKSVLKEKGLMDAALYKRLRMARMLSDHSSHGADPWVSYSIYPYTLDEKSFLREALAVSEAEVKSFEQNVADVETRT